MFAPFTPSPLTIGLVRLSGSTIVLEAAATTPAACCPACGMRSVQIHDRYQRHPTDLPWRGHRVQLALTVRRFRCPNTACARVTFAETFGASLPRYARRTRDAQTLLVQITQTAGAEAGARLARCVGVPASPDTLLRLLRRTAQAQAPPPRVLSLDDLSLRRGRTYATIFIDLETHRPLDLLPGREAEPVAQWLAAHPSIEVIVRDRSETYAEAARIGAPQAQQVADRFHLVQNASTALDEMLQSRRRRITYAAHAPPADPLTARPPSPRQQRQTARREARIARWKQVQARHAEGHSMRRIAREMGLNWRTVRRLLATPEPPRNQIVHPRPGGLQSPTLQPYVAYLQDRWQQGCTNVNQLFRELVARGYTGSRSLLQQAVRPWRPARPPVERGRVHRRSTRWLCLRPPDQLSADEREALQQFLAEDVDLAHGYDLLQRFRRIVADRDRSALATWLDDAQCSGLASFVGFANGLVADRAAVEAALTLPWSQGPTEGHIHRAKLLKRQGYGRAKLDLLRARIVAS